MWVRKIQRQGNSRSVGIPKELAKAIDAQIGDYVGIFYDGGGVFRARKLSAEEVRSASAVDHSLLPELK